MYLCFDPFSCREHDFEDVHRGIEHKGIHVVVSNHGSNDDTINRTQHRDLAPQLTKHPSRFLAGSFRGDW